jgi:hypothetical protein
VVPPPADLLGVGVEAWPPDVPSPFSGGGVVGVRFFSSPCSVGWAEAERSVSGLPDAEDVAPAEVVAEDVGPAPASASPVLLSRVTVTAVAARTTVTAAAASRTRPLRREGGDAGMGPVAAEAWAADAAEPEPGTREPSPTGDPKPGVGESARSGDPRPGLP